MTNEADLQLIADKLEYAIQVNYENISLKKEIEQLKQQNQNLQNRIDFLIRDNNLLKEKITLSNIEISNLQEELKLEKNKNNELMKNNSKKKKKKKKSSNPFITENYKNITSSDQEYEEGNENEITESDVEMLFNSSFDNSNENQQEIKDRKERRKANKSFLPPITQVNDLFKEIQAANIEDIPLLTQNILIESHPNMNALKTHLSIIINSIIVWLRDFGEKDEKTENFVVFLSNLIKMISPKSWDNIKNYFSDIERVHTLLELHKVELLDHNQPNEEEEEDFIDFSKL